MMERERYLTPVVVLRDTASGQPFMISYIIDLPKTAALGAFVPIQVIGCAHSPAALYNMFERLFVGYAQLDVVPDLSVKDVTLLFGDHLAYNKVLATPNLFPTPCEVADTKLQEEVFLRGSTDRTGLDIQNWSCWAQFFKSPPKFNKDFIQDFVAVVVGKHDQLLIVDFNMHVLSLQTSGQRLS